LTTNRPTSWRCTRPVDRTRLGKRLRPRRDVRHIAEDLAARIEHRRVAIRAASAGLPTPSFLRFNSASARWVESAARTERSASFSCDGLEDFDFETDGWPF
jgi:hypothetical protein